MDCAAGALHPDVPMKCDVIGRGGQRDKGPMSADPALWACTPPALAIAWRQPPGGPNRSLICLSVSLSQTVCPVRCLYSRPVAEISRQTTIHRKIA